MNNNVEIIIKENGPSGRMYLEKYVMKNHIDIYNDIISFCNDNDLKELSFKEKVYHYVNDIKEIVLCKNPNCNNKTRFKNSTLGYGNYCSIQCISSDPNIKAIKEKKSYEKYGTKAPAMNKRVKDKMINTNNNRYGGNSPLNNKDIIEKSLKSFRKTKINKNLEKYKNYKNLQILGVDYDNKTFKFKCDKNHVFDIDMNLFRNRNKIDTVICTVCNPVSSFSNSGHELQFRKYIEDTYKEEILYNDRNIIGKEIDIYLPKLMLGFEFNEVYWHNELHKPNNFHLDKTVLCEKNKIKLIHVYQDDWLYKQNIVKSRILNLLGKSERIMARKCIIKEIDDNDLVREFLDQNHLQGFVGSKIKIGLFFKNVLVSLMTFGDLRKLMGQKSLDGSYEMLRFCNKLNNNVIGGASRLFKYFIDHYEPKEVISYADRSWSSGNLYENLGFKLIHKTQPNYYYVTNDGIRKHRFEFRKDVLIRQGFDPNKTEHEIMLERKIYRIYDSGHLKYKYENKKKET